MLWETFEQYKAMVPNLFLKQNFATQKITELLLCIIRYNFTYILENYKPMYLLQ